MIRNFFDKNFVTKNAQTPETTIITTINTKVLIPGTPTNSFTTAAEPVLVFDIKNKARNEKDIAKMFMAPNINKNSSLFDLENLFPITAICPLLNAGKNKLNGEKNVEAKRGLNFFIFIFSLVF